MSAVSAETSFRAGLAIAGSFAAKGSDCVNQYSPRDHMKMSSAGSTWADDPITYAFSTMRASCCSAFRSGTPVDGLGVQVAMIASLAGSVCVAIEARGNRCR